jgi:hypothetical protein
LGVFFLFRILLDNLAQKDFKGSGSKVEFRGMYRNNQHQNHHNDDEYDDEERYEDEEGEEQYEDEEYYDDDQESRPSDGQQRYGHQDDDVTTLSSGQGGHGGGGNRTVGFDRTVDRAHGNLEGSGLGVGNASMARSFASGVDSQASREEKKKRDRSDDYEPHRFSHKLEAVPLPEHIAKVLFPQGNLEAPGSAHRHCFCFFGLAMRRTTHLVKKARRLLVAMTYESIALIDTDKGELLRIIPVLQILSPVYCVLEERLLHLKVEGEHDVVLQFEAPGPNVSHSIDILCDRICELYFMLREEDLDAGETADMIERLDVVEIPTSKQLVDVSIKRPPHVSYPAVRMKELLRYENPPRDFAEIVVPPEARAQIPDTLAEIPLRSETFVTTLNKSRIEDLSKQLALLASHRSDVERERDTLYKGNDMLRAEYQGLNLSVQSLRTAVQLAYKDAERAQGGRRGTRRVVRRTSAPRKQQQQMQWERGSDEPDLEGDMQEGFGDDGGHGGGDEEYDEEVEEEEDEDNQGQNWEDEEEQQMSGGRSRRAQEQKALNVTIQREMRILNQKLKLVKVKLMQAQEQASRLWTRTDRATDLIAVYQDALLRLEFVAQQAAAYEAGATQSKPALEKQNRDLRMELKALKLLDQVTDEREAELVKAETDVAKKKKVLQDKLADEDKALDEAIRPQRLEYERHMAEVTSYFEAESEKASARAAVEFHEMHTKSRSLVLQSKDLSVKERVDANITSKVSTQLSETKYLRTELQKRANFVAGALVSLRDENEGIKRMLNDLMKEHSTSLEAHLELRTRLLDTQRGLAEERSIRKDILERTKDQIVSSAQEVLRRKDEEIARTRRVLFEMQDSLQRAANTFGLRGGTGSSITTTPNSSNIHQSFGGGSGLNTSGMMSAYADPTTRSLYR